MYRTNMILSEQKCAKKKTHSESKLATLEQLNKIPDFSETIPTDKTSPY